MTEQLEVQKVADQYQKEGYIVSINPPESELPPFLSGHRPDIMAEKDRETALVFVRTRDALTKQPDLGYTADVVNSQPGWRFDLVVVPDDTWPDKLIEQLSDLTVSETSNLVNQVRQLHAAGYIEAAVLLAWSAIEASLRFLAARSSIPLERKDPRFVISTLYSEGVLSYSSYEHLQNWQRVRNTLAHGLKPSKLNAQLPLTMADFIDRLLKQERVTPVGHLPGDAASLPEMSEIAAAIS